MISAMARTSCASRTASNRASLPSKWWYTAPRVASSSSAERVLYPDRATPERQQEMLDDLLGRLRP